MKKLSLVMALALVIGGITVTSCSSKETRTDEPVISGTTATEQAAPVAQAEPANLGSASSGQGR